VDSLPEDRPWAVTILGRDLVIWKDGEGQWRAFDDACPHCKVALSEGRKEADGTLACAYHGWRFDGSLISIAKQNPSCDVWQVTGLLALCGVLPMHAVLTGGTSPFVSSEVHSHYGFRSIVLSPLLLISAGLLFGLLPFHCLAAL
jgi:nitrite reductase/ring-hydroxylating ferredoxin subunit